MVSLRKVVLTMNEFNEYTLVKNYVDKGGRFNSLRLKLGCSERTAGRKIAGYRKYGKSFFRHKNHDKKPFSTIPKETKNMIISIYNSLYFDCNFTHFHELLLQNHPEIPTVSLSTLRNIFKEVDILSPKAWRRTRTALKKKDKISQNVNEDNVVITAPAISSDPHPRRERSKYAGEIVFLDASIHNWFGNEKCSLHAAIDDASGTVLAAFFDKEETLNGYYHIFADILRNYGIPYQFNTDRRSVFEYKRKNKFLMEEDFATQFGYACKSLGINLRATVCAQAQGKIERLFQTLQSRLPVELRLAGVTTIEQANSYLVKFIKKHNDKFAAPLKDIPSAFELQPSNELINLTLAVISTRTVDHGHCISYGNNYYRFLDGNGNIIPLKPGQKVQVIKALDGRLFASCKDINYTLEKASKNKALSPNIDFTIGKKKTKKIYVPPAMHPWKSGKFEQFASELREVNYSFMDIAYTTENFMHLRS